MEGVVELDVGVDLTRERLDARVDRGHASEPAERPSRTQCYSPQIDSWGSVGGDCEALHLNTGTQPLDIRRCGFERDFHRLIVAGAVEDVLDEALVGEAEIDEQCCEEDRAKGEAKPAFKTRLRSERFR